MEPGFDQKTWLDYVTMLNDRQIKRNNSNGLTVWALIGVIGVLLFKIIDEFNVVFQNPKSLSITIIFLSIVLNLGFSLILIILSITPKDSSRAIITDIAGKGLTLGFYTGGLLTIFLTGFNYNSAIFSYQAQLSRWPFYVLSLYYFINLFGLAILIIIRRKAKVKVEQDEGSKLIKITLWVNSLLVSSMTIISIREVLIQTLILSNQGLLKVALELTTIIACFMLLSFKYIASLRNNWLEDFEKEIIIKDLSKEQIRSKFIEGFLGKRTLDWLSGVQNEILKTNDAIQELLLELNNNFLEFNNETLEIEEILEILNFNNEFITKIVDRQCDYAKYIELRTQEINNFSLQGLLSKEEKGYIDSIRKQWNIAKSSNEKMLAELRSKLDNQKRYLDFRDEKELQEKECL